MNAAHSILPQSIYPATDLNSALIVDTDDVSAAIFQKHLASMGYDVRLTSDPTEAVVEFRDNSIDIVFISADILEGSAPGLIQNIQMHTGTRFVPVVVTCRAEQESKLDNYLEAGADDFIIRPVSETVLFRRVQNLARMHDLHTVYRLALEEQEVGKKIHTAAISTRMLEVDPIRSINRSAAVFSGDLILIARKPGGNIHVMLSDFTGHGLSAAIGALPVADTFCVMTEKGFRPDVIIRQINRKLYSLLPTSMFMSMAFLQITPELDKVHVWNAGMPHIYLIDGMQGGIKQSIQSTSIPLGVVEHMDDLVSDVCVDVNEGDSFMLHSDGLTECENEKGEMFGVQRLEDILSSIDDTDEIFTRVMGEFNDYYGMQALADDVSLVTVPCVKELFDMQSEQKELRDHVSHDHSGSWKWGMELSGASMHDVDPVPMIIGEYSKLLSQPVPVMDLHNVLTELYRNALEHGAFRSSRKNMEREHRCNRDEETNSNLLDGAFVHIDIEILKHDDEPAVYIRIEDSGRGFDHEDVMSRIETGDNDVSHGYGLSLVSSMTDHIKFNESGSCVEVILKNTEQE